MASDINDGETKDASNTPEGSKQESDKVTSNTPANGSVKESDQCIEYPPLLNAIFILSATYSALFLTALDRTVISTAIPAITNAFQSFEDVGWYESAYMLAICVSVFFRMTLRKLSLNIFESSHSNQSMAVCIRSIRRNGFT